MVVALLGLTLFLFSWNYQSIYNTPENKGGSMDMSDYDLSTWLISATMSGEWEFYYNKWIISEDADAKPDAAINVPGRWTGMKYEREKLSRWGYASYRMLIVNPPKDSSFTIRLGNYPVGCRAFINGELNMVSGTVSKEKGESTSTGIQDYLKPYAVTDESELEVVIELGYNGYGGLFFPPWPEDAGRENKPVFNFTTILIFLMVGAMAACVRFSFVIRAATGSGKAKWISILFILLLFLHVFTPNEFNGVWFFSVV